jgi:hypothetical protein
MVCRAKAYRGAGNPKWRGGRTSDSRGRSIVYAPGHPDARLFGGTHIYEYRLIAAEKIGRPLAANEIVHHINGDHSDNRPGNLSVMTQGDHFRLHIKARARKRRGETA